MNLLSDEALELLRENDPHLAAQFERRPATHPQPHAPRLVDRRRIYNIIIARYPEIVQPDDDDGDVIDGEWRRVR